MKIVGYNSYYEVINQISILFIENVLRRSFFMVFLIDCEGWLEVW